MKPKRKFEASTLIRHRHEQKAKWELERREFEALLFPNGEGHLSMQEFLRIKLDAAAELELRRAGKA